MAGGRCDEQGPRASGEWGERGWMKERPWYRGSGEARAERRRAGLVMRACLR